MFWASPTSQSRSVTFTRCDCDWLNDSSQTSRTGKGASPKRLERFDYTCPFMWWKSLTPKKQKELLREEERDRERKKELQSQSHRRSNLRRRKLRYGLLRQCARR
ncbi:hypothetical protein GJAV_G00265760 [Gymnothorax javanicus]|nr:hypothetical protein GJAV_G00265760 [Gymnothorax javanicus]